MSRANDRALRTSVLFVVLSALFSSTVLGQSIIYVDEDASGSGDGSSWADAFASLQDALAMASSGDEVWVAEGTYWPDRGVGVTLGDRSATFSVGSGVSLFGGFDGTESERSARSWADRSTILSGDLAGDDLEFVPGSQQNRLDNSVHVISISGVSEPITVDGFVVTAGHANGSGADESGAGVRASSVDEIRLRNMIFENHSCADKGCAVNMSDTRALIDSVVIRSNSAGGFGGFPSRSAVWLQRTTVDIRNSRFEDNVAEDRGGALSILSGAVTVANTQFIRNVADDGGAVAVVNGATAAFSNVLFTSNIANCCGGGAILVDQSDAVFVNAVFIANSSFGEPFWGQGGAIAAAGANVAISNSSFAANVSEQEGAFLYAQNGSVYDVRNVVAYGNSSGTGEDIHFVEDDSLFADALLTDALLPTRSHVPNGVIRDDPLFADIDGSDDQLGTADDNLRVLAGSPTIDAGRYANLPIDSLDLDIDGKRDELLAVDFDLNRRVFGPGPDLGAYEFGAPPVSLSVGTEVPQPYRLGAFPNPTPGFVSIRVVSSERGVADLIAYNMLGQEILRSTNDIPAARQFLLDIDLSPYSSGMYLLRLLVNGRPHSHGYVHVQ